MSCDIVVLFLQALVLKSVLLLSVTTTHFLDGEEMSLSRLLNIVGCLIVQSVSEQGVSSAV